MVFYQLSLGGEVDTTTIFDSILTNTSKVEHVTQAEECTLNTRTKPRQHLDL